MNMDVPLSLITMAGEDSLASRQFPSAASPPSRFCHPFGTGPDPLIALPMPASLVSYSKILEIVGDILRVEVPADASQREAAPRFNDLAVVQNRNGTSSLAQVIP